MDFAKLKNLVKKLGGLLVLDDNEPAFVVLPYDRYQKMESGEDVPVSHGSTFQQSSGQAGSPQVGLDGAGINNEAVQFRQSSSPTSTRFGEVEESPGMDEEAVEKLNREILALKDEIRLREEAELVENSGSEEVVAEAAEAIDPDK